MARMKIRAACESDLAAINAIYNHFVLHSTCMSANARSNAIA